MAAYADVVSLMSMFRLLKTSSHTSIAPSTFEVLQLVFNEILMPLEDVLRRLDTECGDSCSDTMHALDGQARVAVRKFEDTLDTLLLNHITLSQSDDQETISLGEEADDEGSSSSLVLPEQVLLQEIDPIKKLVKEMEDCFHELKSSPLPEQEDDDDGDEAVSSKMVGTSHVFEAVRSLIFGFGSCIPFSVSIFGMAGIGKTTIAREVLEHPSISSQFDSRLWVTVGPRYTWKGIIRHILARVDYSKDHKMLMGLGETELEGYLNEGLKDKRYIIVLDDLWDGEIFDRLQDCLPLGRNRIFLVTTRITTLAYLCHFHHEVPLMDKEKSWDLLREKVFGEERCPPQLEKAGKKIAENCEGLPLLIVQVAKLLSKADKTLEYWSKAAEKRNNVFMDAHDQILEVLLPSYTYLPTCFKACFVYMGVFPHKYEIPCSKLINLWYAEGFTPQFESQTPEEFVADCINGLLDRNLIMGFQFIFGKNSCRLHSVFWHLCNREAGKNKFFHVSSRRADSFAEGIRSQRRLCIHNNVLFSIKDVYDSVASVSTACSLLCTGPYHQYPVSLCFGLRLLKVLYALSIHFYEFPTDVLKLVLLRYLALTYDGEIPPSICKLWNLEFFTVHRHLSIKAPKDSSYLPMEIWDMKELKHIEIMGCDLPDPCGAILPNLLTLSGVGTKSCSRSVFEGIPKMRRLRIQIELALDATEPLSYFDNISLLDSLESLKCVIVNPSLRPLQASITNFSSSSLQRLTLSGFGYPWEDMRVIASLPNLEVLKLRSYAFRGPEWEIGDERLFELQSFPMEDSKVHYYQFLKLKFLLIEDTDLVQWRITRASFPSPMRLSITHCYKLEEIPLDFAYIPSLQMIEVVDCSPLALIWVKQVKEARRKQEEELEQEQENGSYQFTVCLQSSWDDGNIKTKQLTT